MFGKTAQKVLRIAKGTSLIVGATVMVAVVLGVATAAVAGTGVGATFNLGKTNSVNAVSKLAGIVAGSMLVVDNNGSGTALDLQVGPSTAAPAGKTVAPMKVDSQAKVDNLNADELDGKDSGEFATKTSEAWRPITASGTSPYDRFYAGWTNFDGSHSTAAYYKDPQGIVHLKGVVRGGSFQACCFNTEDGMIFLLPRGYWPSEHRVFTTLSGSNTTVGRVDVNRGACYATQNLPAGTCGAAVQAVAGDNGWISLDGISFRAEG